MTRKEYGEYLDRMIERRPGGWEARLVEMYGREGAIDVLTVEEGRVLGVNLSRRPWASSPELKRLVRDMRMASHELTRATFVQVWADEDRLRS